ncbi:DedA family protein [bacterium]|nr:DedA family protein [bacterium]MBU1956885.1 DedA family protein [bacterium]
MLDLFVNAVFDMGYIGFFFYMIIVGTFIPLPTQLILLPAGFLASQGKLDIPTTLLVTALGTTVGATINYFMAGYISERFVAEKRIYKVKKFFDNYGKLSVVLAPLSFGMGQYISLPAGIAKMDLRWFIPLIFFSNALWNFAMLMLGYMFGEDANSQAVYLVGGGAVLMIVIITIFVYREFKSY